MSFDPNIGAAQNNHWESNWEPTTKLGARCRVEIDIEEGTPRITLATQSAFSHLIETISKFIPFQKLRNWTLKLAEPSRTVITNQVIDNAQAERINKIIRNKLQESERTELQNTLHERLSDKTKDDIPGVLHDIFNDYVNKQPPKRERTTSLNLATLFEERATSSQSETVNEPEVPLVIATPVAESKEDIQSDNETVDEIAENQEKTAEELPVVKSETLIEETIVKNEMVIEEKLVFTETKEVNEEKIEDESKDSSTSTSGDSTEEEPPPALEEDTPPPPPTPVEEDTSRSVPTGPAPLIKNLRQKDRSESDSSLVIGSESDVEEEPEIEIQTENRLKSESQDENTDVQIESTAEQVEEDEPPSIEEIKENLVSEIDESRELSSSSSESTESDESNGAQEVITYSYEEIKMEASPDAVAKKVKQRVNEESQKVKSLIEKNRERLEALINEYPKTNFETISAKLTEIEANLEAITTVYVVRWMGMKYPTPVANLNAEQLLAFEAEASSKIKSIEQALLSDQFGIKRLTKVMTQRKKVIDESDAFLNTLEEEKQPLRFRDANTKKFITQLSTQLSETKTRQKQELTTMLGQAGTVASLLPFAEKIETLTKELSHQVAMSKQSLEDEKFLETLRKATANKKPIEAFKIQLVENVKRSISAFEKELKQVKDTEILAQVTALSSMLSDNFKGQIRKLFTDIGPTLDVFKNDTYPFAEGLLSFVTRVTDKPLKDASGFQLVQYRREAGAGMESARTRLRPYQEALKRAVDAKKLLNECQEIAVRWVNQNDGSIALQHLKQLYDDSTKLESNLKPCDTIEELLEFADTLKGASGKLLGAVEDIFNEKTSTKSPKKKAALAELSSRAITDETVWLIIENTLGKIEAYRSILEYPLIAKRLSDKAKEALTKEIEKFAASAPQPTAVQTPEAKAAYQKKVKLWGLTALSNLENRCHLIALKESLLNYESLVKEANEWRPSGEKSSRSPPLQLTRCLTLQNQAIETAMKRISGGNGVVQAVKAIDDSIVAIASTQKMVVAIWEDVRGEVAGLLEILEVKKGEINQLETAGLTQKFKDQLLEFISEKIAKVEPYYTSLPPKGYFTLTWNVPFENMDEKSLVLYRQAVDQLKTSVLEEVENTLQLDRIKEADAHYQHAMNVCNKWIEYLENNESNYVLAAYVQAAINKQLKEHAAVSGNIGDFVDLTNFCTTLGKITSVLTEAINVVDARVIPAKPLTLFEQFKIIEQDYINQNPPIIVPQYDKLRGMLLGEAGRMLDACIEHTQTRSNEVEKSSKPGWEREKARLETLKKEFTPAGGITGMLKGMIFSQAIPLEKLNSDQMNGYLKEVYDTHQRLIKT